MNLTGPSYYSQSWPFVDLFKYTTWISGRPEHRDPRRRWNDQAPIELDARGWIRRLAPGQVARSFVFGAGTRYRAGRYTVLYEGRGQIDYRGAVSNVMRADGRDSFDLAPGGELWLEIAKIDPARPLREIRVLPPGGRCGDDVARYCEADSACSEGVRCVPFVESYEEQPFHPEFLADLAPFRVLRFLDWVEVNRPASPSAEEANVRHPTRFDTWPKAGNATYHPVPFEVMVDLCNTVHADLWLPLPHEFDDISIRRVAELIRDRLDPTLRVWVEHSNEVWNGQFGQHYATAARECARLPREERAVCDGDRDGTLCEPGEWNAERERCFALSRHGHARRTGRIASIFDGVFGSSARQRVVRVLAWQVGSLANQAADMLDLAWDGHEPLHRRVDVVAIAPYFGWPGEIVPDGETFFARNEGSVHGAPPGTYRVLSGAPENPDGGPYRWIASDVATLRSRPEHAHLRLVAYEGGQHLFTWASNQGPALRALNTDPRMRDLYTQYLTYFHELTGGSVFVHYASPGGWWQHGAFGSKEYQGQPRSEAPKHDALAAFADAHRAR